MVQYNIAEERKEPRKAVWVRPVREWLRARAGTVVLFMYILSITIVYGHRVRIIIGRDRTTSMCFFLSLVRKSTFIPRDVIQYIIIIDYATDSFAVGTLLCFLASLYVN